MLTVAHLARMYTRTYTTTRVKITKPFMVLAMLRTVHFVMNHTRFIVMATLTSSTDMGNMHSLYRKAL